MSLNDDDDSVRLAFCRRLKATRERSGISLHDIAESTKICASHLAALERGDLRYWPKGFFRRAFFRGYVGMIGLPVEETLEVFVQLFPEDEPAAASGRAPRPAAAVDTPRLALDACWHGPATPLRSRVAASAIDLGAVALVAVGLSWWLGRDAATITAVVAVTYFTLATIVLGDTPAAWALRLYPTVRAFVLPAWHRAGELARAVLGQSEQSEPHEERPWTSDAHRVAPEGVEPRYRVRFKWSP